MEKGNNNIRLWVDAWREAEPELERMRADDIRKTDTVKVIRAFEGLLPGILAENPPSGWSGLVEQQRLFAKLRHE